MAGLAGKEDLLTRELPGGWKQRLALACAVLHQPRVVFLDEPTSGVDPLSRRRFWALIDEMSAEGVTVFVTTHYLDEAEHCHRLALIHAGRLVALGTVAELKQRLRRPRGARGRRARGVARRAGRARRRSPGCCEASVFGTRLHVVVADAEEGAQPRASSAGGGGQRARRRSSASCPRSRTSSSTTWRRPRRSARSHA